jgi:hypothetical protein
MAAGLLLIRDDSHSQLQQRTCFQLFFLLFDHASGKFYIAALHTSIRAS